MREFDELSNEGDEEETGDQVFLEDIQMQKTVESPIANSEQSAAEDEEEATYHLDGQSGASNDSVTDEIYADRIVPNQTTSANQFEKSKQEKVHSSKNTRQPLPKDNERDDETPSGSTAALDLKKTYSSKQLKVSNPRNNQEPLPKEDKRGNKVLSSKITIDSKKEDTSIQDNVSNSYKTQKPLLKDKREDTLIGSKKDDSQVQAQLNNSKEAQRLSKYNESGKTLSGSSVALGSKKTDSSKQVKVNSRRTPEPLPKEDKRVLSKCEKVSYPKKTQQDVPKVTVSPIIPPINSKQIDIKATRDKIRFSKVDSTELVPRNNICVKQDDRMKTKAATSQVKERSPEHHIDMNSSKGML